jgi:hypothetical protein
LNLEAPAKATEDEKMVRLSIGVGLGPLVLPHLRMLP